MPIPFRTVSIILVLAAGTVSAADTTLTPTPFTAAYSAGEWVVKKLNGNAYPSALSKEKQAKFEAQLKEDWIKDDAYACMWDTDWITKYKKDVCK
jgi:hypothetical protein